MPLHEKGNVMSDKLERRDFIKKAALGTAALGGMAALGVSSQSGSGDKNSAATDAAPTISKGRKQWTAVSAFGKAGLLGRGFDRFAKFVGEASGGRLTIKTYHAGELVKGLETMDAVLSGTAQMGFGAPYYWAGKSDSISFVAAIPFGLTAQEQNAWCYNGGGIEMADKHAYNPLGLKFLPLGNTGNQMGGWYNKEINSVNDFKGLKFRMPGLGGEILKSLGTNVVLLPGSEVLVALASGAIDGTEWIGPAADLGKGLHKVAKYYYYPGWHEPGTILDAFFDKKEWDKLDSDLQAIVTYAAATTNLQILSEFQAVNNVAMSKLIAEGVQVKKYNDTLIGAVGKRAESVIPKLASKSGDSKALFNHLIDFRSGMVQWGNYSEAAFLNARSVANFKKV